MIVPDRAEYEESDSTLAKLSLLRLHEEKRLLKEENNQLKDECYKKRNDNKSLRGTIKSILETSNNRHNEIKRLLVKIEKLETEVDSTNSKVSELANRIIDAIGYIRYCQINEKDIFPVIEAQKMMEILEGGSNES